MLSKLQGRGAFFFLLWREVLLVDGYGDIYCQTYPMTSMDIRHREGGIHTQRPDKSMPLRLRPLAVC